MYTYIYTYMYMYIHLCVYTSSSEIFITQTRSLNACNRKRKHGANRTDKFLICVQMRHIVKPQPREIEI